MPRVLGILGIVMSGSLPRSKMLLKKNRESYLLEVLVNGVRWRI